MTAAIAPRSFARRPLTAATAIGVGLLLLGIAGIPARTGLPDTAGGALSSVASSRRPGQPADSVAGDLLATLARGAGGSTRVKNEAKSVAPAVASDPAEPDHPAPPSEQTAPSERPAAVAQLAGVVLTRGARRATIRTPIGTASVTEGDRVGGRSITRIGADRIELRDGSGEVRVVRIGHTIALD